MQEENSPSTADSENSGRPKSLQRLRYEAQLQVLREKNGGLEAIRQRLGFSQKQMCELLLVDASAWTRWIKPTENAPAHIYQALDWYLATQVKSAKPLSLQLPKLSFIETEAEPLAPSAAAEVAEKLAAWDLEKNQLLEKLKKSEQLQAGWKIFLILNSFILFYLILTQYFSL